MKDLVAPVSNKTWHSVPSNSFPMVCTCSDIGNDSSTLILLFLDLSTFPKYVVLKSEFSSNLMVLNISDCIPLYTSKYSSFNLSGVSLKSNSNLTSISFLLCNLSLFYSSFTVLILKLWRFFECLSYCI